MPVTDPAMRVKLFQMGLDPDTMGDPIPLETKAPEPEQQQPLVKPSMDKPSFVGAGFREALRNVLPAGAGVYGATLGAGLGALTGPFAPLAVPVLSIAGGMGTAALAKYAQDGIINDALPDSISKPLQQSEQQDAQQQPLAVKIGGAAANLPFFKVSPSELGLAAKALAGRGGEAELNALKNLGISSGTQMGINGVQQLIQTGTIDPTDLGISALAGFANKPTALGGAMGLTHGIPEQPITPQAIEPNPVQVKPNSIALGDTIGEQLRKAMPPQTETLARDTINREEAIKQAAIDRQSEINQAETKAQELESKAADKYLEQDKSVADYFKMKEGQWDKLTDETKTLFRDRFTEDQINKRENLPDIGKSPAVGTEPIKMDERLIEKLNNPDPVLPPEVGSGKVQSFPNDVTLRAEPPKPIEINSPLKLAVEASLGSHKVDLNPLVGKPIEGQVPHTITPPIDNYSKQVHLGPLRPTVDALESLGTPAAKTASQAVRNFNEDMTLRRGKYISAFHNLADKVTGLDNIPKSLATQPLNYIKQSTKATNEARDYFWDKQDGIEPKPLSKEAQQIVEATRKTYGLVREDARAYKDTLGHEAGKDNPDYFSNGIARPVIEELNNNPDSLKSRSLTKDYMDYMTKIKKMSPEQAKINLKAVIDGLKSNNIDIASQFGPLDKAAGEGVPRSWRNPNLIENVEHYADRAARRLAYASTIQKPEGVEAAIKSLDGNANMKSILRNITGSKYHDTSVFQAATNVVKSTAMGIKSTLTNITTSPFFSWQHLDSPLQWVKNYAKSIASISDGILGATETGRIRRNFNSLELGTDTEEIISSLRQLATSQGIKSVLNRAANISSDITGKNWSERLTRGIDFQQGKFAAIDFHQDLLKGKLSKSGKEFFNNFAKGVDISKPELTREDLNRIAGNFVDATQGTYDERGLPKLVTDLNVVSPVLSLARWSFEKANNYAKYALTPLVNGNPRPFVMSTLGILLGGAASTAVSQLISGRKPNTATIDELKQANKADQNVAPDLLYKMTGLVSAAGHMGVMADLTKTLLDRAYGKNRPQVFNNILLEASDNMANTIMATFREARENGVTPDLAIKSVSQMLEDNMQSYRVILTYLSAEKQQDIDKANKMRDLRVFNTLNGNKIADLGSPYTVSLDDLGIKQYKKEQDMVKAGAMVPDLVKNAKAKATNNPAKLEQELAKIKGDTYNTFPDIDKEHQALGNYFKFLKETQGEDEAKKRYGDFLIHQEKSSVKNLFGEK